MELAPKGLNTSRGCRFAGNLWIAGCLLASWPAVVGAQQARVTSAVPTAEAIRIDGALDEPAWQQAPVADGFLQRDPREGAPATEATEVRIVYTSRSLFFGIVCHDANPAAIRATELRRDNDFENDDSVSVLLDTFHDHRNAFVFRTNPLGTQSDQLVTDEGRIVNLNWDEKWSSAAVVTEHGWTAEIEIPFKALRMTDQPVQTWGVDFERVIRRKTELTYWNNHRRGFLFARISQAGHLEGLRNLHAGLTWRIKPFARTALTQASGPGRDAAVDSLSEAGLEDLKYRVASNLTLDFTVNPDFAEADLDEQVVNLTRFPVYFDEKREFFVEGAGIFDYGPGGGANSELKPFFSRRIGLSPRGEPLPIRGGGKLTGKVGDWTVGLLDVQTGDSHGIPARNVSVLRVKRDLFARSNIGVVATNRQSASAADPYNRTLGADANFWWADHVSVQAFGIVSSTPGVARDQAAGRLKAFWDSDFLLANAEYMVVEKNFNPELGWLPRRDLRKTKVNVDLKPRPRSRIVRQLAFRTTLDYMTDQAGRLETRNQDLVIEPIFQSGDRLTVQVRRAMDRIDEPFWIQGLVMVPPGDYAWDALVVSLFPGAHRAASGSLVARREWGFYGGSNSEVSWSPLFKVSRNVSFSPKYRYSRVELPNGRFTAHIVNSQLNYALNARWLTSTTLQYNSVTRFAGLNVRLDYIYRSGDDLFIVYNESKVRGVGDTNRSLIAKLTYSFDFD